MQYQGMVAGKHTTGEEINSNSCKRTPVLVWTKEDIHHNPAPSGTKTRGWMHSCLWIMQCRLGCVLLVDVGLVRCVVCFATQEHPTTLQNVPNGTRRICRAFVHEHQSTPAYQSQYLTSRRSTYIIQGVQTANLQKRDLPSRTFNFTHKNG